MTTDQISTEKLREEILADAGREAEKIVMRGRQDSKPFLQMLPLKRTGCDGSGLTRPTLRPPARAN